MYGQKLARDRLNPLTHLTYRLRQPLDDRHVQFSFAYTGVSH
jgi:hypothetical protein